MLERFSYLNKISATLCQNDTTFDVFKYRYIRLIFRKIEMLKKIHFMNIRGREKSLIKYGTKNQLGNGTIFNREKY